MRQAEPRPKRCPPPRWRRIFGGLNAELNRLQSQRRILLKGGVVLTLDRQVGDFAEADVLIEDSTIREVRPNIAVSADAAAIVDASNRIIVPGFIDTHSHSYQGILRNILANGRVDPDYNRDIIGKLTPAYTPDDAYVGMLATALGMIEMGTTGVIDVSQVNNTPEHSDALIRALQDAGIRAVFGYSGGYGPGLRYPHDIARLKRSYFSSKDQLVTLALGAGPDPRMSAVAREHDVPLVAHLRNVLPQRNDGERLLQLSRAGLLRPGDVYIHCLHLPADTWRLIKESGGHVSLSTAIEMTMGHGIPAIQDALDNGVRPSSELRPRRDAVVGHVYADAGDLHCAALFRHAARARRRPKSGTALDLPGAARIRHLRGRALRQHRQQGRHADAGQGGRSPDVAGRPH